MSWMSKLYETYENNVGSTEDVESTLTPIAHMNANAQLEVTINVQGDFLAAEVVDRDNAVTLIPVTEESAGRSSGAAPHALCDTLSYIAGDYGKYCENEKERNKVEKKFGLYIENLERWAESAHSHVKVRAIYSYLKKNMLIGDLIDSKIVELNSEGFFVERRLVDRFQRRY